MDDLVAQKTILLNKSLKQKEFLIQEIHHRVKNNLQFIISLIDFEVQKFSNDKLVSDALQQTHRRLLAMVLVHEMLYTKDNIEKVSVSEYLNNLVYNITDINIKNVEYKLDIDDFSLNISQCTSLGIITSELITNSIKHAFVNVNLPEIKIFVKVNTELSVVNCIVWDNGIGQDLKNAHISTGIGKKLVDIFSRQLKGEYFFENNNGLMFNLTFPL